MIPMTTSLLTGYQIPVPKTFPNFVVTEDVDARGENWNNVDEECDRDLTDY